MNHNICSSTRRAWLFGTLLTVTLAGWCPRVDAYYAYADRYPYSYKLYYRDGSTVLDIGCVLQAPSRSDTNVQPPTTNAANDYLDATETFLVDPVAPPQTAYAVGDDALGYDLNSAGEFSGLIWEYPENYGWHRAFSAASVTGAAYYGDSPVWLIGVVPSSEDYTSALLANRVNPAYRIPFDVAPMQVLNSSVSGSVYAVAGAGNNVLSSGFITIEYSLVSASSGFQTLSSSVAANGDFGPLAVPGVQSETTAYIRAVYTGDTPQAGLPLSDAVALALVPEPISAGLLSAALLSRWRRQ